MDLSDDDGAPGPSVEGDVFFSKASRHTTLSAPVVYPPDALDCIMVEDSDLDCLMPGQFLNDTMVDFLIRRSMHTANLRDGDAPVYCFSSFFFKKLTRDRNATPTEAYLGVRRWTNDVDIFAKPFLMIPINHAFHWFLAIVCMPGQAGDSRFELGGLSTLRPCILLLDSMRNSDGVRHWVSEAIHSYLKCEWDARKRHIAAPGGGEGIPEAGGAAVAAAASIAATEGGARDTATEGVAIGGASHNPAVVPADAGWDGDAGVRVFDDVTMPMKMPYGPQQDNHYDCGLFVCKYADEFVKQVAERGQDSVAGNVDSKGVPFFMNQEWFGITEVAESRDLIMLQLKELDKEQNPAGGGAPDGDARGADSDAQPSDSEDCMVIDTPGGMPQPAQPASAGLGAAEGSNIPVQVHDEEQARVAQLRSAQLNKSLDEESDADEDARAVTARAGGHGASGAVARANSEDGVARQLDLGSAETAPPSASGAKAWAAEAPAAVAQARPHAPADDSPGMQAALGGLNPRYRESKNGRASDAVPTGAPPPPAAADGTRVRYREARSSKSQAARTPTCAPSAAEGAPPAPEQVIDLASSGSDGDADSDDGAFRVQRSRSAAAAGAAEHDRAASAAAALGAQGCARTRSPTQQGRTREDRPRIADDAAMATPDDADGAVPSTLVQRAGRAEGGSPREQAAAESDNDVQILELEDEDMAEDERMLLAGGSQAP